MKKIVLLLVLFVLTSVSHAQVEMILDIPSSVITGEIVEGRIIVENKKHIELLSKIKGSDFSDAIHIVDTGTITNLNTSLTIDASIVFSEIPKENPVSSKVDTIEIFLRLPDRLQVEKIELPEDFIVLDSGLSYFHETVRNVVYVSILFIIVSAIIFWVLSKKKSKNKQSTRKKEFQSQIMSAVSYEDIVLVWYRRDELKKIFPATVPAYLEFEKVLNQYQFKPFLTESEKDVLVKAYQVFLNSSKEALNGV